MCFTFSVFAGRDHSLSHCHSAHSEILAEASPNSPQKTYFYANSSSCSPGMFEPGSRPTSLVQPDTLLCWHRELFRLVWKCKFQAASHLSRAVLATWTIRQKSGVFWSMICLNYSTSLWQMMLFDCPNSMHSLSLSKDNLIP
jgi:hypothetical protein